jgi:hypothetical protein
MLNKEGCPLCGGFSLKRRDQHRTLTADCCKTPRLAFRIGFKAISNDPLSD